MTTTPTSPTTDGAGDGKEKVAAGIFMLLALATGGIAGAVVAAIAVGAERAWSHRPRANETEKAARRERAARRSADARADHAAWLADDARQRAAYRAARRNWLGADPETRGDEPSRGTRGYRFGRWAARQWHRLADRVRRANDVDRDVWEAIKDGWTSANTARKAGAKPDEVVRVRPCVDCRKNPRVSGSPFCAACLATQPSGEEGHCRRCGGVIPEGDDLCASCAGQAYVDPTCQECGRPIAGDERLCETCRQEPGGTPANPGAARCRRCGAEVGEGVDFCPICVADSHAERGCRNCGEQVTPGQELCRICQDVNGPSHQGATTVRTCRTCGAGYFPSDGALGDLCPACQAVARAVDPHAPIPGAGPAPKPVNSTQPSTQRGAPMGGKTAADAAVDAIDGKINDMRARLEAAYSDAAAAEEHQRELEAKISDMKEMSEAHEMPTGVLSDIDELRARMERCMGISRAAQTSFKAALAETSVAITALAGVHGANDKITGAGAGPASVAPVTSGV